MNLLAIPETASRALPPAAAAAKGRTSPVRATIAAAILAIVVTAAGAADEAARPQPLWELGVGAAAFSIPDYRGSDEQGTYALPFPHVVYRGRRLRIDRDGLRGLMLQGRRWRLDLSGDVGVPVDSDDNDARRGLPDLDPTVELGPQLSISLAGGRREPMHLSLRLPVRGVWALDGFSPESVGVAAQPAINLDLRDGWPGPGWRFGVQAGPMFASRKFHGYYYRVPPGDATAERPAYEAPGGFSGLHGMVTLSRRFERHWVGAFVRVTSLEGATIDDSPLVRRKTNVMAGIAVSWLFAQSRELVEVDE